MQDTNRSLLVLILLILVGGGIWHFTQGKQQEEAREMCAAKVTHAPEGYYWLDWNGYGLEPLCPFGSKCKYGSYEEAMAVCISKR